MKKYTTTKIVLAIQLGYDVSKALILFTSYALCNDYDSAQCTRKIKSRITWLLVADMVELALVLLYILYIFIKLFSVMRNYSRLEYERHKVPLALNFLGLLVSLPLCICGKYFWLVDYCVYIDYRGFYYMYFISSILPPVAYIFTRVNHDCFNCFNRIAPRRYSFFQLSRSDRLSKSLSDRQSILDQSIDNSHLIEGLGASSYSRSQRLSSMKPYRATMIYPCKHGEPDYCSSCEMASLARSSRNSRNITDDITKQIIDDMAPQSLELGEKESFMSTSLKSETLYGTNNEANRYSLTY